MRTPCSICGKPSVGHGFCKNHYRAFMKYGDPLHRQNLRGIPFRERYHIDQNTGCWLWIGGVNSDGYGAWKAHGETRAHRASWVLHNGVVPPGMHVLHKCDRPNCVNPDHLFLGTHQDNMADLRNKGRAYGARGESNYGAKLTEQQALAIMQDPRACTTIAAEYGITTAMVDKIRNGKSWRHLFAPTWKEQRKSAAGRVTLNDKQRKAIYTDTRTQHVIAKEYGVSQSTISVIKRSHDYVNYSK